MPYLERGDVVIDGGNSDYLDTQRRVAQAEKAGLSFVGCGVSGGELGALHGPSLMPGGSAAAWPLIKEPFQAIAAKLDDGSPCCEWIGPGGSGHFVKTVHNGIEYGDMQLIAETYSLLRNRLGMDNESLASLFESWNRGELNSYLIGITAEIFRFKDDDGAYLLDRIRDVARAERDGQMERVGRSGPERSADADCRGGIRPHAFRLAGRAQDRCGRLSGPSSPVRSRDADGRTDPGRAVCLKAGLVCAGIFADAPRVGTLRLATGLRNDREDMAQRLHHPLGLSRKSDRGLSDRSRSAQPVVRRFFPGQDRTDSAGMASGRGARCAGCRRPTLHEFGPELFRRVAHAPFSGQSASGPARLFRGAPLPRESTGTTGRRFIPTGRAGAEIPAPKATRHECE